MQLEYRYASYLQERHNPMCNDSRRLRSPTRQNRQANPYRGKGRSLESTRMR